MSEPPKLSPFGNAVAGAGGALFANTTVFPLDVIKTRIQVQTRSTSGARTHHHYNSIPDAFVKILKAEGIKGLYAGLGIGLLGTVAQNFAYFYAYAWVRGTYKARQKGKQISTLMELVLGAVAGAISQLFTLPIAVITTRQQTAPPSERMPLKHTFMQIIQEDGPMGLWRGLKASLVLCVNPAITYGVFERLKTRLTNNGAENLSAWQIFLLGAMSKTLATIVTYPYIMAKVRLQWKPPKSIEKELSEKDREGLRYKGSIDVLTKVLQSDGLLGWYRGMHTQITKAVLTQAILFVSKDQALIVSVHFTARSLPDGLSFYLHFFPEDD
ncbi:ADP/ATP carrier protein [Quaeritorhiza haematococci]|nr:ADP/ATP carrier protein [Quaeritorhiza haematococci]